MDAILRAHQRSRAANSHIGLDYSHIMMHSKSNSKSIKSQQKGGCVMNDSDGSHSHCIFTEPEDPFPRPSHLTAGIEKV